MTAPTALAVAPYTNYPSTASTTWYSPLGLCAGNVSSAAASTPETDVQSRIAFAGAINNATALIVANARTTNSTLTLMKNGSTTALQIVVTPSTTGIVTDITNTVSVAVDDTISLQYSNGSGTGQLRLGSYVAQFVPTAAGTKQKLCSGGISTSNSGSAFNVFITLGGDMNSNISENNSSIRANVAGTYSDYSIKVKTNARTTNGHMRFRKGGANGNGDVVITATTTGLFKDISNTDTVVESDVIALNLVAGNGATAFVYNAAGCWLTPTTDGEQLVCRSQTGTFSSDVMCAVFGTGVATTAGEQFAQSCLGMAGILSLMSIRVTTNASTNDVTVKLRKNGADGNQGFIFSAASTGLFTDISNTDTLTATDLIAQSISGMNGNIIVRSAGFKFKSNAIGGTVFNVDTVAVSNSVALASKSVSKGIVGTSNAVALILKSVGLSRRASSNVVALNQKTVGKIVYANSNSVALSVMAISLYRLAVSNSEAFCSKAISFTALAISNSVALISMIKAQLMTIIAVSNSVALSSATLTKNLVANSEAVAYCAKTLTMTQTAVSESVAYINKAVSISQLAISESVAYCVKTIPLTLIAVANSIALTVAQLASTIYVEWPERLFTPRTRDRNVTPKDRSRNITPRDRDRGN